MHEPATGVLGVIDGVVVDLAALFRSCSTSHVGRSPCLAHSTLKLAAEQDSYRANSDTALRMGTLHGTAAGSGMVRTCHSFKEQELDLIRQTGSSFQSLDSRGRKQI